MAIRMQKELSGDKQESWGGLGDGIDGGTAKTWPETAGRARANGQLAVRVGATTSQSSKSDRSDRSCWRQELCRLQMAAMLQCRNTAIPPYRNTAMAVEAATGVTGVSHPTAGRLCAILLSGTLAVVDDRHAKRSIIGIGSRRSGLVECPI